MGDMDVLSWCSSQSSMSLCCPVEVSASGTGPANVWSHPPRKKIIAPGFIGCDIVCGIRRFCCALWLCYWMIDIVKPEPEVSVFIFFFIGLIKRLPVFSSSHRFLDIPTWRMMRGPDD